MEQKKTYKVAVTEVLRKVVLVDAVNEKEARRRAEDAWTAGELLLGDRNFNGTEFYVLGEADGTEKELERVDEKDV